MDTAKYATKTRQRHYETVFILSPTLNETQVKEIIAKNAKTLQDAGATSLRQDEWGKKRMAYAIQKHSVGHYFYFRYIGTEECVRLLERSLKLDAFVLRFQTVRLSAPLDQEQIKKLVERAPKEISSAPTLRGDDDFEAPGFDAAY